MKIGRFILTFALALVAISVSAQGGNTRVVTLGVGYLGETIAHPGFVLQGELQQPISKSWSVPIRVEAGYYLYNNYQQAALLQAVSGVRFHAIDRLYMGLNIGLGAMSSWHHSKDGVYEVDDSGNVSKVSSFAGVDFLMSGGCEFGYKVSKVRGDFVWIRPSYMWQRYVNEKALGHTVLEVGYSFSIFTNK